MRLIPFNGNKVVMDIEVKTSIGVVKGHAAASGGYGFYDVVVTSPEGLTEFQTTFAQDVLRAKADECVAFSKAREAFAYAVANAEKALARKEAEEAEKAVLP